MQLFRRFSQFIVLLTLCCQTSFSQDDTLEINRIRLKTSHNLMVGLSSWAGTNLVFSGIGWGTAAQEETKYFHQMNMIWNVVNLGIAVPSLIMNKRNKIDLSYDESIKESRRMSRVFLINAGLDIAYISSGILMNHFSKNNGSKSEMLAGYGKSILLQGSFLMIFDLTGYYLIRKKSTQKLAKLGNMY